LREATIKGDLRRVQWLLDHGSNVNAAEVSETPLMVAAGYGQADVAKYLVSRGADLNAANQCGSALILAICNHRVALAKWLIAQGAHVNAKDETGDTVLHYAARYGDAEIAKQLIDHGAAINARGNGGRTPLYATLAFRASQRKDLSVAKVLLENGADPNIGVTTDLTPDKTPLQLASQLASHLKFPEAMKLLKKYGAK
jgi:ankyrin repeat protein